MFWKLWKYELKCSYRSYLFTYAILLLSALFFTTRSSDVLMMIVSILFSVMVFVVFVLTFVMIIRTYQQSMFTKAGYLTMTLPATSKMVLLVKILNSALWFILSMFVIVFASILLAWRAGAFEISELFTGFGRIFEAIDLDTLITIIALLIGTIESVAMVYFVMNVTHTNYIRRHRGIIAVLLFFGITIVISLFNHYVMPDVSSFGVTASQGVLNMNFRSNAEYLSILEDFVLMLIFYFGSVYILDHKLELE